VAIGSTGAAGAGRGLDGEKPDARHSVAVHGGRVEREGAMALLIVQHKVRDYAAWRPAFDAHETSRAGAGITNGRLYRKADDPNDVVILFDVADPAKARTWMMGDDLRTAMQNAGVVGAPTVRLVD
jgi:hypothetical protein